MSLTAFDGQFSFRQRELATKGNTGPKGMTEEQYAKFKDSPFMKKAQEQEDCTWTMTCERDKKRKERDPAFSPQDSDFTAAKAYGYEKNVNYYTVLGVDEFASLDEVKKAYKKLSLIYHPDKSNNLSPEEKEDHANIFIELKNAYLVLGDQATRRQYDRDRDYLTAGEQVNGYKKKADKASFDASAVLKKLMEMQKPPGKQITQEVFCKIEKFFYGGAKCFKRQRRIIKDHFEYYDDKTFRLDVPRGAVENWEIKTKGGDMNWDTQPDTMRFVMRSKQHDIVERRDFDLRVKKPVMLKPDAHRQPFLNMEVNTVGGRTILLWGRNPLYSEVGGASAVFDVRIRGEAIGPTGVLHFSARLGQPKGEEWTSSSVVVKVKTTYTKIEFFCAVHMDGLVEDLRQAIREVLQWPEEQAVNIERAKVGERQQAAFTNEKAAIGVLREVILDCPPRLRLYEVPMSVRRGRELLGSVSALGGSDQFAKGLRKCAKARGTADYKRLVREQWEGVAKMAPFFGYDATYEGLRAAVQRALWVVREEPDHEVLHARFAELGFRPKQPPPPKVVRRRKLARPPVEGFLRRNDLFPPSWGKDGENAPEPGSETDPDQPEDEKAEDSDDDGAAPTTLGTSSGSGAGAGSLRVRRAHGTFAAAVHPEMIKRAKRREEVTPTCELELAPMHGYGEGLTLYTKPPCALYFYSNLKQVWSVRPGHLRPRPTFAIAVSCPSGAKRTGRQDWSKLRHRLLPMLKQAAFFMLAEARAILPRPLPGTPAHPDGAYRSEAGICVSKAGEEIHGEEDDEGERSEDESTIMAMARKRAAAAAPGGGSGGGMFDFDDLEDLDDLEDIAEEIRAELRDKRRRRNAVREVWRRDARQQAKRSEFFKATEGSCGSKPAEDFAGSAALCKQVATRAFKRGDFFLAQLWYSREMAALGEDKKEARGVCASNRSACLVKAGHCEAALEDAKQAVRLRPEWGRAWARMGTAASRLGAPAAEDARNAWTHAVSLEPTLQHMEGLAAAYAGAESTSEEASHKGKEEGNQAARAQDWGKAIAQYTVAIAQLPPPPKSKNAEDESALLRAVLFANRCAALSRIKLWEAAVADGKKAVEHKDEYVKGHVRLGLAQLGCRMNEEAYYSFAKAHKLDPQHMPACRGREVCLGVVPHWESPKALRRRARFGKDMHRPNGNTRVFAISDVHYDHLHNEEWAHSVHATKFLDDVLLIPGNLSDSIRALERALTTLRPKFRRVFYIPGNHEMWVNSSEKKKFPDSLCKLWAIIDLCDELDVDIFPAAVCKDVYIVPMFSWHNAAFDVKDPFPDPKSEANKHAIWPIDKEQQVWRYMMRLNQANLEKPYHGTVITFSHFAPRAQCPVWQERGSRKTSGCPDLDEQVREVKSVCHAYGHTMCPFSQKLDEVRYVHRPLAVEVQFDGSVSKEPILCIYNGKHLCHEVIET